MSERKEFKISIIYQVAVLFAIGVLLIGSLSSFIYHRLAIEFVTEHFNHDSEACSRDLEIYLKQCPAYEWLMELRVAQLFAEGCEMLYDTRDEMIDFFERRISDGTYVALLLEADGEIAATAAVLFQEYPPSINWPGDKRAYLTSIYTKDEYRHHGYAGVLLEELIQITRENDVHYLWLLASKQGKALYEKYGFEGLKITDDPLCLK